jgi:transketolase
MRNAFVRAIEQVAARDRRVVVLSGDIGNRMFDRFKAAFPDRFYNCGVAEAGMVSLAAGMASCGLRPFCYTIAPFMVYRAMEQIRVDLCYHRQPVVIAGVGAGLCYAELGATHQSCEDLATMRSLPHMTVVCPGDPVEVECAVHAAMECAGPTYLRLGKKGEPTVHGQRPDFAIGRGIVLREGTDVCLLACGNVLPLALRVDDHLRRNGRSARVVSMHTVKPLDEHLLAEVFGRFRLIVTIEEHGLIGGLGAAVVEWAVDRGVDARGLLRIATADDYLHEAGDQDYARAKLGLGVEAIIERIDRRMGRGEVMGAAQGATQ